MKKHHGMRPQDIVVLLKIASLKNQHWRIIDLANGLKISPSEISEALNRCKIARLIDQSKKKVHLLSFMEFLHYGLKYVFPVQPGAIVRGVPTAHSASPLSEHISAGEEAFVWPYDLGNSRGQAIEPLYKTIPEVVEKDPLFYELIALSDAIRVGKAREINLAVGELEKRLRHAQPEY